MQNFLYTADTPTGSEFHDQHTIDIFSELDANEKKDESAFLSRRNNSWLAKPRLQKNKEVNLKSKDQLELPHLNRISPIKNSTSLSKGEKQLSPLDSLYNSPKRSSLSGRDISPINTSPIFQRNKSAV